jgi:hypothetical protein
VIQFAARVDLVVPVIENNNVWKYRKYTLD